MSPTGSRRVFIAKVLSPCLDVHRGRRIVMVKNKGFRVQKTWVQILSPLSLS